MKEKGFILLGMLFMMVLVAVTAVALNRRAGLQARMAANDTEAVQTAFGQEAAIEEAVWQLTQNPCWRVNGTFTFHGVDYTRKVKSSTVAGRTDAVTIAAEAPGASKAMWASFRYYINSIDTPFLVIQPSQVCCDSLDHIYFADPLNHSVWKLNGNTGALTKVAGNGTSGSTGDGGPATSAQLNKPEGVCVDGLGNIYIGDTENHRIRKVSLSGNISTVAGTGSGGYSGDGGLAINAKLKKPNGVSVDSSGNIFIADTENHCIRKVDGASGKISTVAGIGGSEGDTGNGGQATSAKLKKPCGVFVDTSGDIYIADTENCWIRKVDVSTGNISRVAGDMGAHCGYSGDGGQATSAELDKPRGAFVDISGDIYIADTDNCWIRKVDASTGVITRVAGDWVMGPNCGYSGDGGQATNAELDSPRGVCLNGAGEMVIADTMNSCIREVDLGGIISTITGTGSPVLALPGQLAMDATGNVYIADTDNERVRKLDTSGLVTTVAGTGAGGYNGDGIQATSAKLHKPRGVCVAPSGNIYIADRDNHRIRKVDIATGIITTYAGTGSGGNNGDAGWATALELKNPNRVSVSTFLLDIADTENHRIMEVDGTGWMYLIAGTTGSKGYSGDGGLATNAELNTPMSVFLDASLNIFIADTENHCIRRVDAFSLVITTVAGTPETSGYAGDGGPANAALLNKPEDVFVDAAGNIFIADTENHVIRMVCAQDGTIHSLAGDGNHGYNGDDLPAVTAELNRPAGIVMAAVRGARKIFISDKDNDRIRLLTLEPVPEIPY
jgi:sugar lactone lactonase YvrE